MVVAYRSVQIEARDSRLVPASELPRLNADLNEYGNNVNKSIGALRATVARAYLPTIDPMRRNQEPGLKR